MLRDVAGINQVLYGTDFPYQRRDLAVRSTQRLLQSQALNDAERGAVLGRNASDLFPRLHSGVVVAHHPVDGSTPRLAERRSSESGVADSSHEVPRRCAVVPEAPVRRDSRHRCVNDDYADVISRSVSESRRSTHVSKASKAGHSACPQDVRLYSTFGGT